MAKQGSHMKTLVWVWAGGALLYWWLISKLQSQQLVAAAIVGSAVTGVLVKVAATAQVSLAWDWRWLGLLVRRVPKKILSDVVLLIAALGRAPGAKATGAYQSRQFAPGAADAKSATRRALVFAAVSLPPNSFAVRVTDKDSLLVHQLVYQPEPTNWEWPI